MGSAFDLLLEGIELKKQGVLQGAIELYKKAIQIEPNFKEAWYKLAVALEESGEIKNAKKAYQKAIKIDTKFKEAWNNLGTLYYEMKNYKSALKCFQKAIALDSNFQDAIKNHAMTLNALNKSEKAIEILFELTEKNPRDFETWNDLMTININVIRNSSKNSNSNKAFIKRILQLLKRFKKFIKETIISWAIVLSGNKWNAENIHIFQKQPATIFS